MPPGKFKKKRPNFAVFKFCFFAKNAPKCANFFFGVSGPLGDVKTYLDAEFQLIWPSNEARTSGQVDIFDFLGYLKGT